jgi:teichuronic acid biosynthesis glycosyltransferase TuaC
MNGSARAFLEGLEMQDPGIFDGNCNKLRILSLSLAFPNPAEPGLGTFVRSRLRHMISLAEIKVMAPLAVLDYAAIWSGTSRKTWTVPRQRWDEELEVFHPRWLYPPGAGGLSAFFLLTRLLPKVGRLRRRFRFHLIDAHFGHPSALVAALLSTTFACPFVVTLRGDETRHATYALRRYWMSWALRRACRVITVSEPLRQFAIGLGVAPDRVCTIPNGINVHIYFQRDRQAMRRKHAIPPDQLMLLSAGYLIERKGHHRVIRALGALRRQGIAAGLWIVGTAGREGRYEQKIRDLVVEMGLEGHVHFVGGVPPEVLAEYMSAADVFCLASSREGWPNVVHEALGCGTPVVATNVGGVPDLIPAPEYGSVVPIGDQEALETALRNALMQTWNRRAIAVWAQSRSWEQVAEEVIREARLGIAEDQRVRGPR